LAYLKKPPGSDALTGEMPRIGSGGKGDDLNANDRPNRIDAAAATGEQRDRGVDHSAGYKTVAVRRQGFRRLFVN